LPQPGVLGTRLQVSRSLKGLPLQAQCSPDERREAERALVEALKKLPPSLQGEYYPLQASCSYPLKPGGMSSQEARMLKEGGLGLAATAGAMQQEWPDARGVYESADKEFAALINREAHLELFALVKPEGDANQALARLVENEELLRKVLEEDGHSLEDKSEEGPSVRIGLFVPRLAADGGFAKLCEDGGYVVTSQTSEGFVEVGSPPLLGVSTDELMSTAAALCTKLIAAEKA